MSSKVTLLQTLSDPKNRHVSFKFFKFSLLLVVLPIGFLLLSARLRILSLETSAILSVVMVNAIMAVYAIGAYREDVDDFKQATSDKKKD